MSPLDFGFLCFLMTIVTVLAAVIIRFVTIRFVTMPVPAAASPLSRTPNACRYINEEAITARDPEQRARQLLNQLLTPEQRREWERYNAFFVEGEKYDFLIQCGCQYIRVVQKGSRVSLAAAGFYLSRPASSGLPPTDAVIAQLLHVRGNLSAIERQACGLSDFRREWGSLQ